MSKGWHRSELKFTYRLVKEAGQRGWARQRQAGLGRVAEARGHRDQAGGG